MRLPLSSKLAKRDPLPASCAPDKGVELDELVNRLLKREIDIIETESSASVAKPISHG
jgi:hypothetical protein